MRNNIIFFHIRTKGDPAIQTLAWFPQHVQKTKLLTINLCNAPTATHFVQSRLGSKCLSLSSYGFVKDSGILKLNPNHWFPRTEHMIPEFGYQSDFILLVGMFLYPSHFSGAKLSHEVVSGNLSACLCLPLESFLWPPPATVGITWISFCRKKHDREPAGQVRIGRKWTMWLCDILFQKRNDVWGILSQSSAVRFWDLETSLKFTFMRSTLSWPNPSKLYMVLLNTGLSYHQSKPLLHSSSVSCCRLKMFFHVQVPTGSHWFHLFRWAFNTKTHSSWMELEELLDY